jgi:hypothetical protein
MMVSICKEYYQFFLAQGVVTGLGLGIMYYLFLPVLIQFSSCGDVGKYMVFETSWFGHGDYSLWILVGGSLFPSDATEFNQFTRFWMGC